MMVRNPAVLVVAVFVVVVDDIVPRDVEYLCRLFDPVVVVVDVKSVEETLEANSRLLCWPR